MPAPAAAINTLMTDQHDPFASFDGVVRNLDEVRAIIGEPPPPVLAKAMDHIDEVSRKIIERSPFIVLLANPSLAILFPTPGKGETLRVTGACRIVRSKLWQSDQWPDASETAGIADAMIAHARLDTTPAALKARMDRDGITRLY